VKHVAGLYVVPTAMLMETQLGRCCNETLLHSWDQLKIYLHPLTKEMLSSLAAAEDLISSSSVY
jgi:hypothetical protein